MKKIVIILSMIFLGISGTYAITVTGTVTDSYNNPLPGVNVIIKGTTTGTLTDINGAFTINVPDANSILVFSYIGYISMEIQITDFKPIAVVMTEDVNRLEEVIVTGYASSPSSVLTGSTSGIRIRGISSAKSSRNYYPPVQDFNTEGYSAIHENGFKSPLRDPLSTFSIDVDAASYSNVRRFITEGQKPVPDAVRVEEMINYFDYDYPQPKDGHPFSIVYELGDCPWNYNHKLLHIGLQGEKMETEEVPPSNLVFLIDVSGSMDMPNKLPLLIKAMKLLVSQLRAEDRVAIVVYAGNSGLVLPSTPGNQKERINTALERLRAGGSTAGAAGLKLAYQTAEENFMKEGNNRIILATDGDFNVGPSSNAEMERMIETYRNKGIFISVTGFGMGNYKDDKMEIIADKGNGNYAYIDNLMEAKKVFINEFSSTLYTIAKDVKIQIEFNPAYVKEYRLVGYENRLLNEEDFDDDKKDAGELGAGHTVTALYEIVPAKDKSGQPRKLQYQQSDVLPESNDNNELATIKFRYKRPESDKSILMVKTIPHTSIPLGQTSNNFRFSAAVAGFGMLLRSSEYKGSMDYNQVLSLARGSKGSDDDGYRAEFIRLVELSDSGWTSMGSDE
ncbi:MAG: von Willebrand factor type A domain-containing protein [Bacteroidales bacterium]|nr:von Willebrand factor type A domain-containing protein [Bacteroidales bacterium]